MKYLIILLLFISSLVFAESSEHKKLMSQLVEHYNTSEYQKIFALYSVNMKATFPLIKFNEFMEGLKTEDGKIKSFELFETISKATLVYKTTFNNSVLSIRLSSDNDQNISGLYIMPFTEKVKPATSKISAIETSLTEKQLDIIIEHSQLFPNNTQLSIAFIESGNVKYFGLLRKNDVLVAVDNNNKVFEIGSITKVFTSTLLANLVNAGKIDLDDTIDQYLDIKLKDNTQISFKELASHHSGLPRMPSNFDAKFIDQNNPFKDYGIEQLTEYLEKELSLNKKTFAYSNVGVGLLGYTLSIISHKSYQQLLDEVIFKPYKMTNSTTDSKTVESLLIKGLNQRGEVTPNWDLNVLSGAGAILSSVEDLTKFALAQFDQSNKDLVLTRQKTNNARSKGVGLGWFINKKLSGNDIYEHSGGTGGYVSSMVIIPKTQEGIIILSNVSAFNRNSGHIIDLSYDLIKTLGL